MWPTNVMSYCLDISMDSLVKRLELIDRRWTRTGTDQKRGNELRRFPGRFARFPPPLIRLHSCASGGSLSSSFARTLEQFGVERNQLRRLDGLGFLLCLQVLDVVHDQMRSEEHTSELQSLRHL